MSLRTPIAQLARSVLPRPLVNQLYRARALSYLDSLHPEINPAKKTIVALNHFYDQDLRALASASTDFNFVTVDAPTLVRGAKLYYDRDVIQLNAPYDSSSPAGRLAWRGECELLLNRMKNRFGLDLILAPADCFWWIREMIIAAEEIGIGTVVIDKEGIISPYDFDAAALRIKTMAPFMSRHLFVWSERQRQFWSNIGVPDERMTILGQPRSDLFHSERPKTVDAFFPRPQPIVTFFSYMDDAYIPVELVAAENLTWGLMREQTHSELRRLALSYPQYNFVVKTHPQQLDLEYLKATLELENLRVLGGSAVSNELIQRSELIIAFQTTAVIEAMFLGRRIVYTYWSELLPRLEKDLLPFHTASGIQIARSFEQFGTLCEQALDGDHAAFDFSPSEIARRNEFVDQYFYRPDGHVCERFFKAVSRFIS